MDQEPEIQVQLAAKKEERPFNSLNGPGISWLLIILTLALTALAIRFFGEEKIASTQPANQSASSSDNTLSADIHQPRIYTVSYDAGVFSPTNLRIHAGDTVRFKNENIFPIKIVSDPDPGNNNLAGFDSVGDIPQGSYFAVTFGEKGVFFYHNDNNSKETGSIIVR